MWVWVRRFYTGPEATRLVAMDSHRRCCAGTLRRLPVARDRRCRTPWCDAPTRHADHPEGVAKGGETTARNGQGLCEACNYTRQAPGWDTRLKADGAVQTTTPPATATPAAPHPGSADHHPPTTTAQPPPRPHRRPATPAAVSRMEASLRDLVLAS